MSISFRRHAIPCLLVVGWVFQTHAALALCCKCTAPTDAKTNICIQTQLLDCASLKTQSKNPSIKDLTCITSLTDGQCQSISDGGLCIEKPVAEIEYKPKSTTLSTQEDAAPPVPKLGVPIPGLNFQTDVRAGGGVLRVPWFAQYVSAVQKYLIGISAIAAAIMITYGGFLYIWGSAASTASKGRAMIADALIGLGLVLGAYTILSALNPNLVTLSALDVQIVHRRDAFEDPAQERARVVDSATVPYSQTDTGDEIPIIDVDPQAPKNINDSAPGQASGTPSTPNAVAPGTIARDQLGNLIAQNLCPIDMVPIVRSQAYQQKTGKNVPSFCIDIFEAPNQKGAKPFAGVTEWEADWYCQQRGKRLCSISEWQRACLGPQGINTYGYGPIFIPGKYISENVKDQGIVKKTTNPPSPCNYDGEPTLLNEASRKILETGVHALDFFNEASKDPQYSVLNKDGGSNANTKFALKWQQVKDAVAGFYKAEPSGTRPCVTAEGVYDMTANVQEIVVTDAGAQLKTEQRTAKIGVVGNAKPYTWAGFYWSPIAHLDNTSAEPTCTITWGAPHAINWRAFENGFRCCLNLSK